MSEDEFGMWTSVSLKVQGDEQTVAVIQSEIVSEASDAAFLSDY